MQSSIWASVGPVEHGRNDLPAQHGGGPAEMRLENLPHVHSTRHAQRVQADINRRSVFEKRHILFGHDARDDALVPVATGHLVTHRKRPLGGHVDLDHLEHARGQFVAALHMAEPSLAILADGQNTRPELGMDLLGFVAAGRRLDPVDEKRLNLLEDDVGVVALADFLARIGVDHDLPGQRLKRLAHALEELDAPFVTLDLERLHLGVDLLLLLVGQVRAAREVPRAEDDALLAGRQFKRVVLNVFAGTTEDGVQQFLFRTELGLALGRDFADQNVSRPDAGARADDATIVQVTAARVRRRWECRG